LLKGILAMNRPLVSIITPSFNQATFLPATLESVLSQDYVNLELIVMDGGSTDGSVAILEAQTDPRLFWVSESDRGQAHALNKGLKRIKGDIITYINSDDLLAPQALSSAVAYFEAHEHADILTGDCQVIDEMGRLVLVFKGEPFNLPAAIAGRPHFLQPGTFWRRRVFDTIGEFDENLHYMMDYEHWLRAALAGFQIDYTPDIRAAFRIHSQSKTSSQSPGFWRDWHAILGKIYVQPNLPPGVLAVRDESWDRVYWHDAKMAWLEKDYATARPMLRRFLRGKKWVRRGLAAPMLVDSYLGTPFARWMAGGYQRLSGVDLFAP
jgi:glycosyltransferase involved in cell wall biosynthesis